MHLRTKFSNQAISLSQDKFTFSDSSWDDFHDMSISTVGYLIFYQGGVIYHSRDMTTPISMSSAEAELMLFLSKEDIVRCESV